MAVMTRVYEDIATAERARQSLESYGIAGVEVSVLGDERLRAHYDQDPTIRSVGDPSGTATGASVGAVAGGGAGLLAGLGLIAIPGIGPLVAVGWLAAAAAGALGGAVVGGAVGALADIGVSEADAPVFDEALRRGNVAVTVLFPEERRADVVSALDIVPTVDFTDLRTRYEAEGWQYDEAETRRQERLRNIKNIPPL